MNIKKKVAIGLTLLSLLIATSLPSITVHAQEEKPLFTLYVLIDAASDVEYNVASVIREELAKIGINLEIKTMEAASLTDLAYSESSYNLTYEEGGWDMMFTTWWWWPMDYVWFTGCWSSSGIIPLGWNFMGWSNGKADSYLTGAMSTYDTTRRIELLHKWQNEFARDSPVATLYWPRTAQLSSLKFKGADAVLWTGNCFQWTVEGKTAEDDVTIRYAVPDETRLLNPLFVDGGYYCTEAMFAPLYVTVPLPDGTYEQVPEMAESYEISEDGLRVTFHLRRGVTWQDGEPFTAADVKFTFDAVLDPDTGASNYGDFADVVNSVEVVDEYTVVLHLKEVAPHLISLLSSAGLSILPEHVLGDVSHADLMNHETNTVAPAPGTGPYRFVKWVKGQYMELEAFDDYWRGRPLVDHIFFTLTPDPLTALSALEAGEVDCLHPGYSEMLVAEISRLQEEGKVSVKMFDAPAINFLTFNLNHPILSNRYVRLAICHAIPYEHIVKDIIHGMGSIANSPVPPYWFGWNSELPAHDYDLEEASSLLAKAGYVWSPPTSHVEIPMSAYVLPVVGGIIVGFVVGAGVIYATSKRRK